LQEIMPFGKVIIAPTASMSLMVWDRILTQ
jgi:hypothetical protein